MPELTLKPTQKQHDHAATDAWIASLHAPILSRIMEVPSDLNRDALRDSASAKAKRQIEFASGRRCCESLLKRFGNTEQVWVNEDRSPAWPSGFVGSISHSKNWTWATVGRQSQLVSVGIDTEPVISTKTRNQIIFEIATENELESYKGSRLTPDQIFSVVFSAKESFYKCCYPIVQQYFGFEHAVVENFDDDKLTLGTHLSHPCYDAMPQSLDVFYRITNQDVFTITSMEPA